MKITQLLDEAKKGVKAPKHTVKPRNFVAKNAIATTSGAGAHKDKKKAAKQGDVKHKGKELAEDTRAELAFKDLDAEISGDSTNVSDLEQRASALRKQMPVQKPTRVADLPDVDQYENAKRFGKFNGSYGDWLKNKGMKENTLQGVEEEKQKGVDGKACWKGYKRMGTKKKGGKTVDNCVPMNESFDPEYDDEAGMADNNLETLKRAVEGLDDMINEGDNLPEWCQEKIAVAKSMLISVWDYMQSEENSMSENQRNPDLMSQTDYDRYQQGQMDQQKRDFKRDELEHELGHEEQGMYYVVIAKNGKWEHTKAQPRQEGMNAAQRIINALHSKYPSMHLGMVGPDGKVYNYGKGK
jgi:hypothetical protein